MLSFFMKVRMSRFHLITLALFLGAGGSLVGFTHYTHHTREEAKRARLEAADLATAEELRRRQEGPRLPFAVEELTLQEQGREHWLLELKLRYRNDSDTALKLEPPVVSLTTEDGQVVPEFFLAFEPHPTVAAHREEEVQLRYWLTSRLRQLPLHLEIDGDRLPLDL